MIGKLQTRGTLGRSPWGKQEWGRLGQTGFCWSPGPPRSLNSTKGLLWAKWRLYACMHACVCVHLGVNRDLSHKADLVGSPADFSKE